MRAADASGAPAFRAWTEINFAEALGGTRLDITQTYTLIDPAGSRADDQRGPRTGGARPSTSWKPR